MTSRTLIQLVAGREIRDRMTNRGFLLGTGITLLLLVAIVVGPALFRDDGPTEYELGVVGSVPPAFADAVAPAAEAVDAGVTVQRFDDRAAAEAAVDAEEVDGVVIDGEQLLVPGSPDRELQSIVDSALQQAAFLERVEEAGLDPSAAAGLLQGHEPVSVITPRGTEEDREAGFGVAFFATVLLFLTVQINGTTLLTGAIEEKSSRVVEVLLGTLRPWQLLAGKLTGISVLAIGQLVVYAAVLLGANAVVGAFELPEAAGAAVVSGIAMFVVGFGFYAALYAVAGSMATSIEDAQASAGPLGFVTAGVYMAVIFAVIPNPDGVVSRVLTFLPPSAPFAVPARVSSGGIAAWEVVVAGILTFVGTALTVRLAGRLYSAAVLAGGKLRWRDVWRAEPIT